MTHLIFRLYADPQPGEEICLFKINGDLDLNFFDSYDGATGASWRFFHQFFQCPLSQCRNFESNKRDWRSVRVIVLSFIYVGGSSTRGCWACEKSLYVGDPVNSGARRPGRETESKERDIERKREHRLSVYIYWWRYFGISLRRCHTRGRGPFDPLSNRSH